MLVKVWNDNKFPHTEEFQGKSITIPPNAFVEMEEDAAHTFKYQFTAIEKGGDDQPRKDSYKMIRIEKTDNTFKVKPTDNLICNACGYEAPTLLAKEDHVLARHEGQLEDPEAAVELKAKTRKKVTRKK